MLPMLNLVPYPRSLRQKSGFYTLPAAGQLHFDRIDLPVALRLQAALRETGSQLSITTGPRTKPAATIACQTTSTELHGPSAYRLSITKRGIVLQFNETTDFTQNGLRA